MRYRVTLGASPARGPASALVTIVEVLSFTAGASARAEASVAELEAAGYPLRVVWKAAPDSSRPESRAAARAVLVAGREGRFWERARALLVPGAVEASRAELIAGFTAASVPPSVEAQIDEDVRQVQRLQVPSSPWLFVNGRSLPWPFTTDDLERVVAEEQREGARLIDAGTPPEAVSSLLTGQGLERLVEPPLVRALTAAECPSPAGPPLSFDGVGLLEVCRGLFLDPAMPEARRRAAALAWLQAVRRVELALPVKPAVEFAPLTIVCDSAACRLAFLGPSGRSVSVGLHRRLPGPAVVPSGGPKIAMSGVDSRLEADLTHELVHARMFTLAPDADVPAWFQEGLAVTLSGAPQCGRRVVRATGALEVLHTGDAWTSRTNEPGQLEPTYCQAGDEVGRWLERVGASGMQRFLEGVRAGRPFAAGWAP